MSDEPTKPFTTDSPSDLLIGRILGERYHIERLIGRGGMGAVYRGVHTLMERPVAIKMLLPQLGGTAHRQFLERFHQEAINTCKVEHPNAIIVHDFLIEDKVPFIVMEYLKGLTLSQYFEQRQSLTVMEIYTIYSQVCSALSKAHSAGIVHRDLKPDNIMIIDDDSEDSRIKVLDFGIAKLVSSQSTERESLTEDGMAIGTPKYMSPEQARAEDIDGRSDLYSLGVILYELLAGYPPFVGSPVDVLSKHIYEPPPQLEIDSEDEVVASAIQNLVHRALQKKPNARFESVMEFMSAFREAINPQTSSADDADTSVEFSAVRNYTMNELMEILDKARRRFSRGDYLRSFELLDDVVKHGISDAKIIHLAVLNLARSGATEHALDYFRHYKQQLPKTEDYRALEARLLKDQFLHASGDQHNIELGRVARDAYRAIYHDTQGFFTAINAATLSMLIGEKAEATKLAEKALQECMLASSEDYWVHATRAEASLLLNQLQDATKHLEKAASTAGGDVASLSTTYRQLKLICAATEIDEKVIAAIRPAAVTHYTGKMIHGIGLSPGIDPEDCFALTENISALLEREEVGFAFGSLACGADIMVAEAVVARQAELTVVLPFTPEEFLATSVMPGGEDWARRFYRVMEDAARVIVVPGDTCFDHELRFRLAATQAMGLAKIKAENLGSSLFQTAVYNGKHADSNIGTAADIEVWKRMGLQSKMLHVPAPRQGVSPPVQKKQIPEYQATRELNAVIIASITGVDSLPESALPGLNEIWATRLLAILNDLNNKILYHKTWGNRACFVVREIPVATDLADSLTRLMKEPDDRLPEDHIGMRVVVHAGPMFAARDQLGGCTTYFGSTIDMAVALDPVMPLNSAYVTEEFAAHYAASDTPRFRCGYAGEYRRDDYGQTRLYHLKRG